MRITKMVLVIFLSFLTCYLPITVVKTVDSEVHFPGKYYKRIFLSSNVFKKVPEKKRTINFSTIIMLLFYLYTYQAVNL
jgi:hypothetical protein